MTDNVIDGRVLFGLRGVRKPARPARATDATYSALMLKNLTRAELAQRLSGTGLRVSIGPLGYPVLHDESDPPPKPAA